MIWGLTQAARALIRRTMGSVVGASGGTLGQGDGVAVSAIAARWVKVRAQELRLGLDTDSL